MPSKLKKAIGAVKDHTSISLAKVAGYNTSNLDVVVLKATTHDDVPIEDRYVHEILQLVSSNKVYAAACARAIGKRIGRTRNWIVALKSLMLVLRIFQDGDPYFPREVLHAMRRGSKILNLSSFRDDSNSSPWDFTAFVRTFALYLDERLDCFLTGKLQRRYTYNKANIHDASGAGSGSSNKSRGGLNEPVRDMKKPAMLLDKISYWQRLLERAIATRPTGAAKMNRLVQISLYAVVQESFDLYKDISDGLALLLDSFFHLQYQNCVSAFQTCVKASKQFEELSAFYCLCKSMGVGRSSEYPCVQTISQELIETLQEFLKDQSSFPTSNIFLKSSPSYRRILLLPSPPEHENNPPPPLGEGGGGGRRRQDSYGAQSDFSVTTTDEYNSEMTSENTSCSQCTSLEDLISATEISTLTPSISIDLEDYSDKFEEIHANERDTSFSNRLSDSGSSRSLPISGSIGDLVSLEDWPSQEEEEGEEEEQKQKQKQEEQKKQQLPINQDKTENLLEYSNSPTVWELVAVAADQCTPATQPPSIMPNPAHTLNNIFLEQEDQQEQDEKLQTNIGLPVADHPSGISGNGEHELTVTTMPPSSSTIQSIHNPTSLDNLFNVSTSYPSVPSSHNYYNPFLQDTTDPLPTTTTFNEPFSVDFQMESLEYVHPSPFVSHVPTFQASLPAPTFQATPPTSSAQNPNTITTSPEIGNNDPFDVFSNDQQLFSSSMNQQNLLQEQQIWLQNQNKIIAKHIGLI